MRAASALFRELSLTGRLSRGGFWLRHAIGLPIGLFFCVFLAHAVSPAADLPASIVLTMFLISVWARRLHDRGRSAWWLALVLLPVLGPLYLLYECAFCRTAPGGEAAGPGRVDYLTVRGG